MRVPGSVWLAWHEGRSSLRRVGLYMGSITVGVAALVAIHSFRGDVVRSIQSESRSILGADLRLGRSTPQSDSVLALVDSLTAAGGEAARVTTLVSMVLAERNETTRLLQLRAIEGGFPFYGSVRDTPPGVWTDLGRGGRVLVDPAVLVQLDVAVGDTLSIGRAKLPIGGTVEGLPTDLGFQAAVGPRVFMAASDLAATGLLTYGSLAAYRVYLKLPSGTDPNDIEDRYEAFFQRQLVSAVTYTEQADDLTDGVRVLSRFLGLIGLTALLLGGIGVASAVHVYVKDKLTGVAVLRCLGAVQRTVFSAYLLQATVLGLAGSALGVLLGLAVQQVLPRFVRDLLPVDVSPAVAPGVVVVGVLLGLWVAVIFALIPLLAVRNVPPLRALRSAVEADATQGRGLRLLALAVLLASILAMSLWQAPTPALGLAFAGGLALTLTFLRLAAEGLTRLTRRYFPRRARYPMRQGVANLFRPRNQTVAITLALGFGAFLIAVVFVVQRNLQSQLDLDVATDRPNLLLFDVQSDQVEDVASVVGSVADGAVDMTPLVTASIAAINGVAAEELLADSSDNAPRSWAVRRLYRNTYRATLSDTEVVTAGEWWDADANAAQREPGIGGDPPPARISVEVELAEDLAIGVGDRVTWDVQGTQVETHVANLRRVDWARFAPNFYVVFEPGALEQAPQTTMALARVPDPAERARIQTRLVRRHPNVSLLDLATVQEALDRILGRVGQAIRFLSGFAVAGGLIVLIGALATSRFQRMSESALLKTLGAGREQILGILLTEYSALGALAGSVGVVLGAAAAWVLVRFAFEARFSLPVGPLALLWLAVTLLTACVGMAMSRGVLARTPLTVLREANE